MTLGEKILLALSRSPSQSDYKEAANAWTLDTALEPLRAEFPDLRQLVKGARVIDFGCGTGWQAVALAREGASHVLGVDTNTTSLNKARELSAEKGVADVVGFAETIPQSELGTYDVVISQNAMEHFDDPEMIIRIMASALKPSGRILVTFGPPWYAPSGSHMHFFTHVPWVNILFSEKTVMAVRSRYRSDGATRYEDVESGLNRMSVGKFERIIAKCGLRIERKRYNCVKGVNILQHIPLARELFINNVSCVLTPDT